MISQDGSLEGIAPVYEFLETTWKEEKVCLFLQLFVDSRGHIFVSIARAGTFRSTDGGNHFEKVLDFSCWGMTEDKAGQLIFGNYDSKHKAGDHTGVQVLLSSDGGDHWANIGLAPWRKQDHVHDVKVNSSNNWIYLTLGDSNEKFRGCWRSKNVTGKTEKPSLAGSHKIKTKEVGVFEPGQSIVIVDKDKTQNNSISSVAGNEIHLETPLASEFAEGSTIFLHDWTKKISHPDNGLFAKILFHGTDIYLTDDSGPNLNKSKTGVFCASDDGSNQTYIAKPALPYQGSAWGVFNICQDSEQRIWTATRPIHGEGHLWMYDGKSWRVLETVEEEDIKVWFRRNRTFRDLTVANLRDKNGPEYQAVLTRHPEGSMIFNTGDCLAMTEPGNEEQKLLLLVIGAERCGTSWLTNYFRSHPSVFVPLSKQLHFFDAILSKEVGERNSRRKRRQLVNELQKDKPNKDVLACLLYREIMMHDHSAYLGYFNKYAHHESCFADMTPTYWQLEKEHFEFISNFYDKLKILFIVRDPISRFLSFAKIAARRKGPLEEEKIVKILDPLVNSERQSYTRSIKIIEAVFGEESRLIMFYEDLFREESIQKICEFIGADFVPANYDGVINAGESVFLSDAAKKDLFAKIRHEYEWCADRFGDALPDQWRQSQRLIES